MGFINRFPLSCEQLWVITNQINRFFLPINTLESVEDNSKLKLKHLSPLYGISLAIISYRGT